MDTFNPVTYAMNRRQKLMESAEKAKKPTRQVPSKAAALIISQESDDGFLDLRLLPPEGEKEYNGINSDGLSPQHVAVIEAFELLTKYLFGDENEDDGLGPLNLTDEDLDELGF